MPDPGTLTKRVLCAGCLESFPEDQLEQVGDRPLCDVCSALAAKARVRSTTVRDAPKCASGAISGGADTQYRGGLRAWVVDRCAGRWWAARLPLLIFIGYVFVRHLCDPAYQSLFKPLNLGAHELGHFVFTPLGKLLEIAGGSILQCIVPIVGMGMFFRQRDLFAIAVSLGWLGTNLYDVATYARDARAMALPLVRPGGGHAIHDWNYLLGRLGMLEWDQTIASAIRLAGAAALGLSVVAGSFLLWVMFRTPPQRDC